MTTRKPQNDAILAIRINKDLLDQLNTLAKTKSIGVSSLVRMLMSDYIRNEAPKLLLGGSLPPTKPRNSMEAMSPAERKAWEDEWEY